VVDKLNQSLVKIFQTQDAQAKLAAVGADARTNTPDQFAQAVGRERVKWAKIIKESGARAE
jgi:tripartite-type tricarboxylate transporter receptor subunit TctC